MLDSPPGACSGGTVGRREMEVSSIASIVSRKASLVVKRLTSGCGLKWLQQLPTLNVPAKKQCSALLAKEEASGLCP